MTSPEWPRWSSGISGDANASGNDHEKDGKVLNRDLMNAGMLRARYAVRGELYHRATQLAGEGKEILYTNIGNPQQLGQKPITFNRSVLSLLLSPTLMDHPDAERLFESDAIARARELLEYFGGAPGAYTDSRGVPGIRREVAEFIAARDGTPAPSLDDIFLTEGASVGVRYVLTALIRDHNDAILTPIPQYPLYSAVIQSCGGELLPYYLHEAEGWSPDYDELRKSLAEARGRGLSVRAIVFINPGNPTGTVASFEEIAKLLRFAYEQRLVVMADEVYQPNLYNPGKPFVSANKVLASLEPEIANNLEVVSYHTVSKGVLGECGLRGGYAHFTNMDEKAIDELYKVASINLCPNTIGQATVSLLVKPPKEGDASYETTKKELNEGLESLARRARLVSKAFSEVPRMSCTPTDGAMYAFPRIDLPAKAIEAALAAGKEPDTFYCLRLLEKTGIVTVPGSGFGQEEGTFHFRTTILPLEDKIQDFCNKFKVFHTEFMDEFKD